MGARQSKRSVDITTPKKEGIPTEGGVVVGDAAAPGDGKLERIEETDSKPTTNGIAPHTNVAEDKEKDKDEATEKDKEQQPQQEEVKAEETKQESSGESPAEVAEITTPTETTPASPNTATSPDSKETKKKDKKKKWSFRSISFSKKDKTKPAREETPKNGDVTKEEPLAEGGEEAESATAATSSPVEEKSGASSPSADEKVAAPAAAVSTAEPKEEAVAASPAATGSPVEEKKEEPTPSAPTPVPVEDKKEEAVEKVDTVKKVVEVSPAGGQSVADPIEVPVFRVQPVATSSIIERKTSEDFPSLPPSSPPPTPIDPSPLQQARQAAASATALAEALKLPAEAANKEEPVQSPDASPSFREDVPQESRAKPILVSASPRSPDSSTDLPSTEVTLVSAKVECPPVMEAEIGSQDVAYERETLANSCVNKETNIDPKIGSVLGKFVAFEDMSKYEEGKGNRVENIESVAPCDTDSTQVENIIMSKVECPFVPKEVNQMIDDSVKRIEIGEVLPVIESELKCFRSDVKPLDQFPIGYSNERIQHSSRIENEMKVPDIIAQDKAINDTLPLVESQVKIETSKVEDTMKINVSSNFTYDEKPESSTLLSTEIETNNTCPATKQHLSAEDLKLEKMENSPSNTIQHAQPTEKFSHSHLSPAEKCAVTTDRLSEIVYPESVGSPLTKLRLSDDSKVDLCEGAIMSEHDYAKTAPEESKGETITLVTSSSELITNSEEESLSVSEDILVEAKLAVVIPEDDSVEELTDTTESVKVIPETDEEKIENEPESDTTLPIEENLVFEEFENTAVSKDIIDPNDSLNDTFGIPINVMRTEDETINLDDRFPSPPPQHLAAPNFRNAINVPESAIISPAQFEETKENERNHVASPAESYPLDESKHAYYSSQFSNSAIYSLSEQADRSQSNEPQTRVLSSGIENVPIALEDLPPTPDHMAAQNIDSFDYPSPPIELSYSNASAVKCELQTPTETLLTPPVTPNFQSNNASGIATVAKDCSQIHLYDEDERSDRGSKTGSNVYDESDIELKERLAVECLTKTESQEEALSCHLSNNVLSSAAQENHQNVPETEAPIENNVAHDISTTESVNDAPKVAPPAIPTEASLPTAPAITEDVASVTKAIEEIDISDKAVAAAVNEAIECNTNEIITDAHHQNNVNE